MKFNLVLLIVFNLLLLGSRSLPVDSDSAPSSDAELGNDLPESTTVTSFDGDDDDNDLPSDSSTIVSQKRSDETPVDDSNDDMADPEILSIPTSTSNDDQNSNGNNNDEIKPLGADENGDDESTTISS